MERTREREREGTENREEFNRQQKNKMCIVIQSRNRVSLFIYSFIILALFFFAQVFVAFVVVAVHPPPPPLNLYELHDSKSSLLSHTNAQSTTTRHSFGVL